jgi:phosphoribosylanthranilate isomerase
MFVKICGITRERDAQAAVDNGAAAIGFVFWEESPRFIEPERARAIVRTLPPFVTPVGVFVNSSIERVNEVANAAELGAVQLHGEEQPDVLNAVTRPVVKALGRVDEETAARWPERVLLLVDADDRVRRGGTGVRADWQGAARVAATRRILLAGGITPANVAEAVRTVRPFGIDVSSGVEESPGIKDAQRMRELFDALRGGLRS